MESGTSVAGMIDAGSSDAYYNSLLEFSKDWQAMAQETNEQDEKTSIDSFDIDPWDQPTTSAILQSLTITRVKDEPLDSQNEVTQLPDSMDSTADSIVANRASIPPEDCEADPHLEGPPIKRPAMRRMHQVKTFVFFDLETTGLLSQSSTSDYPITERIHATSSLQRFIQETPENGYPHITELAMVAVDRDIFMSAMNKMNAVDHTLRKNGEVKTRRVALPSNVHSRLIKPKLNTAEWAEFEKKRGANPSVFHIGQFELSRQRTFIEEWLGIRVFLQGLPKPVCIVAHNGIRFDFPILYGELTRNHIIKDAIPSEVYFLDSWVAFRAIDQTMYDHMRTVIAELDWKMVFGQKPSQQVQMGQHVIPSEHTRLTTTRTTEERDLFEETQTSSHSIRQAENTGMNTPEKLIPTRSSLSELYKLNIRRSLFSPPKSGESSRSGISSDELPDDHPLLYLNSEQWSPSKRNRGLDRYFLKTLNGKWEFDKNAAIGDSRLKGNYRLENLYKQNIHDTYEAHSAEPDCFALAQVCLSYGEDFVKYADNMAASFPF